MDTESARIFAAVLAAGGSSRYGSTKQLAKLGGVPLVRRAAATAARACGDRVVTVLGHDWPNVLAALGSDSGFVVINNDYLDGMGTSIAAAARICSSPADAIIIVLADQPLVGCEQLRALIARWSGAGNEIVATAYDSTQGPPVLFPKETFGRLQSLSGDTGARTLLQDDRFVVKTVPFAAASIDIDTPEDLASLS